MTEETQERKTWNKREKLINEMFKAKGQKTATATKTERK